VEQKSETNMNEIISNSYISKKSEESTFILAPKWQFFRFLYRSKPLISKLSVFFIFFFAAIQADETTPQQMINTYRMMLHENQKIKEETRIRYQGFEFDVMPGVLSPKCFSDIFFYADTLPIHPGQSFLEIGSGMGLVSIMAAIRCASNVSAVDNNPVAANNTMKNALRHNVAHKVRVYEGDFFSALPCEAKFDIIFCHLPYLNTHLNKELLSPLEEAIYDPQNNMLKKCLEEAKHYLTPSGNLFLGYMSTCRNLEFHEKLIKDNGWIWRVISEKEIAVPRLPGNCGIHFINFQLIQLIPKQNVLY
jgi:release factor glutamine methyltransferase